MGFTDRIGDAWNWLKDTGAPAIGGAFTAAGNFTGELFGDEFSGIGTALGQLNSGLSWGMNMVDRAAATTALATMTPEKSLTDWGQWQRAWNLTDTHDVDGLTAPPESFGQVLSNMTSDVWHGRFSPDQGPDAWLSSDFRDTPQLAAKRAEYNSTWYGQLTSGALDFSLAIVGDPNVAILKAAKGVELARATIEGGETTQKAFSLVRGETSAEEAGKAATRGAQQLNDALDSTVGKTPSEIASMPMLQGNQAQGSLAYLFHRADLEAANSGAPDALATARETKLTLMGALLGDTKSIQALKTNQALLGEELNRLMSPPQTSWAVPRFTWEDGNKGVLFQANQTITPEVAAQAKQINAELARLNTVLESQGTGRAVAGTFAQKAADQANVSKLRSSTIYSGIGNRPIVIVGGALGNRLEGHINVRDPQAGYAALNDTLNQARLLSGEEKANLLDNYLSATTRIGRANAVQAAEKAVIRSTADEYDIPEDQIQAFMLGDRRRQAVLNLMKTRLYSAAPTDGFVSWADAESDISHVISKPILQSQVEDFQPMLDPRQVDRTLRAASQSRILEDASRQILGSPNVGTAFYNTSDWMWDVTSSKLQGLTQIWKDSVLLARAPAYVFRAQLDSQARLMATMGPWQAVMATRESWPAMARYWKSLLLDRDSTAEGRLIDALSPWFEKLPYGGFTKDETGMIVRAISSEGGSFADLASEMADKAIEKHYASGDWSYLEGTHPDWFKGYVRAVNREIRNSPTAMRFAEGHSIEDVRNWVLNTSEGQHEWNEVSDGLKQNLDGWLDAVEDHVNHYLPTPMLREWALRKTPGELGPMAEEKLFAAQDLKLDLIRSLNLQIPATSEIQDIATAGRQAVQVAQANHADIKGQVAEILANKRAGQPFDADQLAQLRRDQRKAYADYQAKSAATKRAEQAVKDATKAAQSTETEARSVQAAQTAMANPQRPTVTWDDVQRYFTENAGENRMRIHGTSYSPNEKVAGWARYENFRRAAYREISDMPETILARVPLYLHAFQRELGETFARAGAEMGPEEIKAARIAAARTAQKTVTSALFDSSDVSNLAHNFRFISPFFAAWEDTMKKWGNLVYQDPQIGERIRQAMYGLSTAGPHDEHGNLVVPMTWIPSNVRQALNLGPNWKMDPQSVNSIFQGEPWWLPSLGPLAQLPANEIVKSAFPQNADGPIIKWLLPYGISNENPLEASAPAWLRRFIDANPSTPLFGTSEEFEKQADTVMRQELTRFRLGQRTTMPTIDEVSQKVRNRQIMRGLLSMALPFTISPDNEMQYYFDLAHKYQQADMRKDPQYQVLLNQYEAQYGKTGRDHLLADHPEYQDWYSKFAKDNPGYEDLAISISANDSGLVATNKAVSAYVKYKDVINAHKDMAWLVVGPDNAYGLDPDGQYSDNAHTYELNQGLRTYEDPQQTLVNAQVQRGWSTFMKNRTLLNVELDKRGLKSVSSKGAEDLNVAWADFLHQMENYNPDWAQAYEASNEQTSLKTLDTALEFMDAHPEVKSREDMQAMQAYVDARQKVMDELARRGSTLHAKGNEDLADAWNGFVTDLRQWSPGFEQIWNRSLEKDQLSMEVSRGRH